MEGSPIDNPVPLQPTVARRPDAELASAAEAEAQVRATLARELARLLAPGVATVSACGAAIQRAQETALEAAQVAYGDAFPLVEASVYGALGSALAIAQEYGCELPDPASVPSAGLAAPAQVPQITGSIYLAGTSHPGQGGLGAITRPEGFPPGDGGEVVPVPIPEDDGGFEIEIGPDKPVKPAKPGQGGIGPIPIPQQWQGIGQIPWRPIQPRPAPPQPPPMPPGGGTAPSPRPRPRPRPGGTGVGDGPPLQPGSPPPSGGQQPPQQQQQQQQSGTRPPPKPGTSAPPIGGAGIEPTLPEEGEALSSGGGEPPPEEDQHTATVTINQGDQSVTVNVDVEQTCSLTDTDQADEDEEGEGDEDEEQEEEEPETEEGDIEPGPPALPILARIFDQDMDKTCVEMKRLFEVLKTLDDGGVGTLKAILTATTPEQFDEWWSSQQTFGPDWLAPLKFLFGAFLFLSQTANALASILFGQQCDKDPGPYVVRWIVSFLQRWLGDGVKDTITSLDYIIRHNCPILIPSTAEANRLYFLGDISADIWECWVKMNGDKPDIQTRVVESMRAKPSVNDWITLYLRGKVSLEKMREHARFAGGRDNFDLDKFIELRQHVPPIDAIIRFMIRDTFVEEIVTKYGYDDQFVERFDGRAEAFGRAHGFDRDTAKLYWRAHWHLPSPTQAYEMMFRLRPGRVPTDVETTRADVEQLLMVADYPTYWRKRLVEISHRRLRILDVRRAYYHGQIDQAEMIERGQDIGYTRRDAEAWARLQQEERYEWWTKQRWGKAYLEGYLSEDLLRSKMEVKGMPLKDREAIVSYLKEVLETNRRKACVDALEQRVLTGDLNVVVAGQLLVQAGLDVYQAEQIALGWECARSARLKFEGAGKWVQWAKDGIVSTDQLVVRLTALGFTPPDIDRMVMEVQLKQREQARKIRAQIQRQRQAQRDKRSRELRQQAKAAASAAERAAREADKAERIRQRIEVRERQCVELWAEVTGLPLPSARTALRSQVDRFRKGKRLSRLSSLDLICGVLRDTKRLKSGDPMPRLDEAYAALPEPAPPAQGASASVPRQASLEKPNQR